MDRIEFINIEYNRNGLYINVLSLMFGMGYFAYGRSLFSIFAHDRYAIIEFMFMEFKVPFHVK